MQIQSRRGFIGSVAAGIASLSLDPSKVFAAETLGLTEFTEMVKTRFYFANSDGTAYGRVKLLSVEDTSLDAGVSQFNLHFRGNRNVTLSEGLYSVTNWSGLPNFDVHIQMVGTDSRGRELYLANFAQLQQ